MKKRSLPALLLCLVLMAGMMLTGCSKNSMDLVVGRVGAENVTFGEVTMYANYLLMSSGYSRADMTAEDIAALNKDALDHAVTNTLICQKAAALGLYPLSAENQKTADDQTSQYIAYMQASGTDLSTTGLTEGELRTLMTVFQTSSVLLSQTTRDVTVTDDEIQKQYNTLLTAQQTSYTATPSAYDTAVSGGSTTVVYRPEGYRYVKHILITYPEDISSQITTASTNGDTAAVASLRKQGLAQIQDRANEALSKVKDGGDFDALMAQYGEDPGMQAEPAKSVGYQLGATSSFVPEFLAAAMGLAKAGDTTGLVATDFGCHIIKYVGAVPAGPVPLDEVREGIRADALAGKQDEAYNVLVEQWKAGASIRKNLNKIPAG